MHSRGHGDLLLLSRWLLGTTLSWTQWSSAAAWATAAATLALTGAGLVSAALVWRWFDTAPAAPEWPLLAAPLVLGCIVTSMAASEWARRRRRLLG